jgi:hypothetical protein
MKIEVWILISVLLLLLVVSYWLHRIENKMKRKDELILSFLSSLNEKQVDDFVAYYNKALENE